MIEKQKIRVLSSSERAEAAKEFVLPDPGNIMIAMIFGWSLLCFFLVIAGERFLFRIARLATSTELRKLIIAGDETVLTILMLGGCAGIIALVTLCSRYKTWVVGFGVFSFSFGSAAWKPLHDTALIIKYLLIVYLAVYAGFFLLKNFWRLLARPYIRIVMVYFVWAAIVQLGLGGRTDDIWYMGTETAMIFGLGVTYANLIKDAESLLRLNKIIAWAGILVLAMNCLAPVVVPESVVNGRFQSMYNRATGFAVSLAPVVLAMFWMGMYERNQLLRQIFVGAAIVSLILILWSGTRSATLAILVGVTILWWVFRTRIFVYMFLAACLGLIVQVLGTAEEASFQQLADRFLTESNVAEGAGRFEIWGLYLETWLQSPITGHSSSGLDRAFLGEESAAVFEFVEARGGFVRTKAVHSVYVGTLARLGLVGFILFMIILYIPLRNGFRIISSNVVPDEEKHVFVLPLVLVTAVCIVGIFEDCINGVGRGSIAGYVFWLALIVCGTYGLRIAERYDIGSGKRGSAPLVRPKLPPRPGQVLQQVD